ncbi:MAG: trans-2-enoyl-CoA reductase family protein [Candidatus Omnitrophica bacterium]|nr:trans-2-enoyl-CoA reductase family protein [Candidatus Omnitrophota bacterium]
MIVQPKIRGFICTTAHPVGCARHVQEQIAHVIKQGVVTGGPKKVLVIGASAGFGMASRIVAAFGSGAATFGVYFERPSDGKRTATAGWYNTAAFEAAAHAKGLYAKSVNGDAFSDEIKQQVVAALKKDLGQVDMVVYSLASPRRTHPKTGETFKSTLKPTKGTYTNKSMDFEKNEIIQVTLEQATPEDVDQTVQVMGGEDWQMWIELLKNENLLAPGCLTVAYSYIGPEVTQPIYRQGTIGAAKDHLEKTAHRLDKFMAQVGGRALVSVNKALVTQASSAIPFISLYIVLLMKDMKARGIHEGCIEQMDRLFRERLFNGRKLSDIPVDAEGRVRVDDWEVREDVQAEVKEVWKDISTHNVLANGDVAGYNKEFLKLFGFGYEDVNYDADVEIDVKIG